MCPSMSLFLVLGATKKTIATPTLTSVYDPTGPTRMILASDSLQDTADQDTSRLSLTVSIIGSSKLSKGNHPQEKLLIL